METVLFFLFFSIFLYNFLFLSSKLGGRLLLLALKASTVLLLATGLAAGLAALVPFGEVLVAPLDLLALAGLFRADSLVPLGLGLELLLFNTLD